MLLLCDRDRACVEDRNDDVDDRPLRLSEDSRRVRGDGASSSSLRVQVNDL